MEIITLGIGTPSDVPHFLLVGLSTNPVVNVVPDGELTTQDAGTVYATRESGTIYDTEAL